VGTRERKTLLKIIAALCECLKIVPTDREAAGKIARLTERVGARVSDETVRKYLDIIPEVVESRQK
jgi:hypothetical protein